jgi:hypothetical protein
VCLKNIQFVEHYCMCCVWFWFLRFAGTLFKVGSEWPSSGYKQIERGLLLDFGFNSTPLVIMFIFVVYYGEKVVLSSFHVCLMSCLPMHLIFMSSILGTMAKLRKLTVSFIMAAGRIFLKFYIQGFFKNLSRKAKFD